jgi:hypothetical protein
MWPLTALLGAGCVQAPPHATLTVDGGRQPNSHAVLVLPTTCTSLSYPELCLPATYATGSGAPRVYPPSFAAYIDPALRLKLEFAGFTLAEAGAMRITTADRVDVNGNSRQIAGEGPQTVADLGLEDVRAVAASLALPSVLVPTLTIGPARHAMHEGILNVALVEVSTMRPRWTVTCREILYTPDETTNRLANCAGNGVLAIIAPENLIGKAL